MYGNCQTIDVIVLQETWFYSHNLPFLGSIDDEFAFTGKISMDTLVLHRGRPYGRMVGSFGENQRFRMC